MPSARYFGVKFYFVNMHLEANQPCGLLNGVLGVILISNLTMIRTKNHIQTNKIEDMLVHSS